MVDPVTAQHPMTERPQIDFADHETQRVDEVAGALVGRAAAAQGVFEDWSEERVDRLLHALANVVAEHAHSLAVAAVAETGMGNIRDKSQKNIAASLGLYSHLAGQVGHGEMQLRHRATGGGDRQPDGGDRRADTGHPPCGHIHLQGLDRAQGAQRHHSQSQPASAAGVAASRSIDSGRAARDGRARRSGSVARCRQQPAAHHRFDGSPACCAGPGDGRPGNGQSGLSVRYAGDRRGAGECPCARQRRCRPPLRGAKCRPQQVVRQRSDLRRRESPRRRSERACAPDRRAGSERCGSSDGCRERALSGRGRQSSRRGDSLP